MLRVHKLKIEEPYFVGLLNNWKTFEIRKDDRGYCLHDYLKLVRNTPGTQFFTVLFFQITDILQHQDFPQGIQPGYVILSLRRCSTEESVILDSLPIIELK